MLSVRLSLLFSGLMLISRALASCWWVSLIVRSDVFVLLALLTSVIRGLFVLCGLVMLVR